MVLGVLAALLHSAPADGHGRARTFPSLDAAGTSARAHRAERRLRSVETSALGRSHAAEHARQRVLARRGAGARVAQAGPLEPDNGLAPQVGGVWAPSVPLPIVAIHSVLLRTGKVLYFAYPYRPGVKDTQGQPVTPGWDADADFAEAYVFDPASGTSKRVTPPTNPDTGRPAQIFCAGASTLPDGRVLVAGGDVGDPTATKNSGLNTLYTFDPVTERWTEQQRMRQGRWYPTQLQLPDGRTAIISGQTDHTPASTDPDRNLGINTDIEVFSPDGTLKRIASLRLDRFDDDTDATGRPATTRSAPFPGEYPHAFWMPAGHGLVFGPRKTDTWRLRPSPAGTDNWTWQDTPNLPTYRQWAAGVLLPGSAQVMLFGGADVNDHAVTAGDAVRTTVRYDDATGSWPQSPSMDVARAFANSVLLPDGEVAVVGGGTGDHRPNQHYRWELTGEERRVELFDPVANRFKLANRQAEGRTYHSSAVLLPDGRVMSAGDDINGAGGPGTGARTDTAELWSPPYLFDADGTEAERPSIDAAPSSIGYGRPFVAGTSDDVRRAVLVAPGAATHNTDMSQRVVPLAAPRAVPGGVGLSAPANANLAPPGYYMLFLLDADGTPSKARFVRLGAGPSAPTPTPVVTPTTTPASPSSPARPATKPLRLRVTATPKRLTRLRRSRRLTVRITASRAASGRVVVRRGKRRLAPARTLQLRAKRSRVVRLRLSKAGRRALRSRKRATLVLRVTAVPAVGDPVTATRRLRLKR